jgi:hypothetical protein
MNSTIKDKLKIKPQVHEYEPVVVMLQEEREKEEKEKEQVLVPIVSRKNKTTEVTDDRITDYDRTTLKKRILENKIFIPSLTEQQSIVSKLDSLSIETKKLEAIYQQKLNDLEELKKAILQKAFNGELVKE